MSEAKQETSMGGCFLSAFRNLAGPGLLLATGAALIMNRPAPGSGMDLLFLTAAAATVVAGLLYKPDHQAPKEGTGEIAAISRTAYVVAVLVVSAAVWGLTHFVLRP